MFAFYEIGKDEYDNLKCPCLFEFDGDRTYAKIEFDVYLINLNTHEIEMEFSYPDVYTTYELNDNILKMNYIEGGETSIDFSQFLS